MKIHDPVAVDLGIEVKIELRDTLIPTKVGTSNRVVLPFLFSSVDFILGKMVKEIGITHLRLYGLFDSHIEVF